MEMRLQRRDNIDGIERIEVSGHITRNGWHGEHEDPLVRLYGADIYSQRVIMNLARVEYIDSLGVEWLLSTHRRFQAAGGQLILHSIGEACKHLLTLMKMDLILCFASDEGAARQLMSVSENEKAVDEPQATEQAPATEQARASEQAQATEPEPSHGMSPE